MLVLWNHRAGLPCSRTSMLSFQLCRRFFYLLICSKTDFFGCLNQNPSKLGPADFFIFLILHSHEQRASIHFLPSQPLHSLVSPRLDLLRPINPLPAAIHGHFHLRPDPFHIRNWGLPDGMQLGIIQNLLLEAIYIQLLRHLLGDQVC